MQYSTPHTIFLDFETFYDVGYTLAGAKTAMSEYVRDERFKAHMVGWAVDDEPLHWCDGEAIGRILGKMPWSESTLVCHNTAFDGFVLSHHFGIYPARYADTMLLSRAVYGANVSHSLNEVAGRAGFGSKMKGVLPTTKGMRDLPDDLLEKLAEYCLLDVDLTRKVYNKLHNMLPEREADLIDITLRMFCDPVLGIDRERVGKELEREVGTKAAKVMMAGVTADDLLSNEQFARLLAGYIGLAALPTKVSPATKMTTYAFAKKDQAFTALRKHSDQRVRDLVEARLAVKSTIGETRAQRFLTASANDWRLPVLLQYCGAHTTRWSAGNKMNLQNLKRGGELRKSILAPPGQVIVTLDSSQIEARTNLWLAGDDEKLEIFRKYDTYKLDADGNRIPKGKDFVREGPDLYRVMAAKIYNIPVEDVTDDQRFVGKVCVLALGYGMGATKLQHTLATDENKPMQLSIAECQRIVNIYRESNAPIVNLWGHMEQIVSLMCAGVELDYRALRIRGNKIFLPSGLAIHYDGLRGAWSEWLNKFVDCTYLSSRSKTPIKLYGGLVTENAVQGLARVIVADQMWEIAAKYRIVMMTHDEVSFLAKKEEADEALQFGLRVFSTPPEWAPTLPVNAEGKYGQHYMK